MQSQQIDQIQFFHNFVSIHLFQHLNSKIKIVFHNVFLLNYYNTQLTGLGVIRGGTTGGP